MRQCVRVDAYTSQTPHNVQRGCAEILERTRPGITTSTAVEAFEKRCECCFSASRSCRDSPMVSSLQRRLIRSSWRPARGDMTAALRLNQSLGASIEPAPPLRHQGVKICSPPWPTLLTATYLFTRIPLIQHNIQGTTR